MNHRQNHHCIGKILRTEYWNCSQRSLEDCTWNLFHPGARSAAVRQLRGPRVCRVSADIAATRAPRRELWSFGGIVESIKLCIFASTRSTPTFAARTRAGEHVPRQPAPLCKGGKCLALLRRVGAAAWLGNQAVSLYLREIKCPPDPTT
eukprot:gene9684-biopygen13792